MIFLKPFLKVHCELVPAAPVEAQVAQGNLALLAAEEVLVVEEVEEVEEVRSTAFS